MELGRSGRTLVAAAAAPGARRILAITGNKAAANQSPLLRLGL